VLNCGTMNLSDNQTRAIEQIHKITDYFGEDRWFTKAEVIGAGYHTMEALVNKGILRSQYFEKISYYQLTKDVKE
jgi:hypothetical protein